MSIRTIEQAEAIIGPMPRFSAQLDPSGRSRQWAVVVTRPDGSQAVRCYFRSGELGHAAAIFHAEHLTTSMLADARWLAGER